MDGKASERELRAMIFYTFSSGSSFWKRYNRDSPMFWKWSGVGVLFFPLVDGEE